MITHFWSKLVYIYWESLDPLKLLTLVMYPFAAYGLYRSYTADAGDTNWMFHLSIAIPAICHALGWGLLITYIFVARSVGLFSDCNNRYTKHTVPFCGMTFWTALLASNLADPDHLAFGLLFAVCAMIETWIFSRVWQEG